MEQAFKSHTRKEGDQTVVHWQKPCTGWFKLNSDGSPFADTHQVAGGGLLRDEYGGWVVGFSTKFLNITINVAELLALREGLKLAWDK
ncbi:hypothetical protein OROHE_004432 [Orobanche hederae]